MQLQLFFIAPTGRNRCNCITKCVTNVWEMTNYSVQTLSLHLSPIICLCLMRVSPLPNVFLSSFCHPRTSAGVIIQAEIVSSHHCHPPISSLIGQEISNAALWLVISASVLAQFFSADRVLFLVTSFRGKIVEIVDPSLDSTLISKSLHVLFLDSVCKFMQFI